MDVYLTAFHTRPKSNLFLKIRVLYMLYILNISASFPNRENGRYLYTDDLGFERYCHYCPPEAMHDNENIIQYQEPRCFDKNFPFQEKCDQEELDKNLRPICKSGTLPSCRLPKQPKGGHWNCTSSLFYNIGNEDSFVPVYTICQMACDPGFIRTDGASTYCRESRLWDLDPATLKCHNSKPSNIADTNKKQSNETTHSKLTYVSGRRKNRGHHKINRRHRKKLSQILRLEKKLVKLKMAMLSELGGHTILDILLK
ncbi:hypothetical protein CHS0354_026091 [Potamilus streckersoni]|uniref:Sushi domain-containing protein n=1 Tax=Potamilus streckersoni TaxID=2493646 RepID=A0AAE0VWC0_9BIVA|nr:hypothetical protein CHS0354_026091 [Potamilus streckersoni]